MSDEGFEFEVLRVYVVEGFRGFHEGRRPSTLDPEIYTLNPEHRFADEKTYGRGGILTSKGNLEIRACAFV